MNIKKYISVSLLLILLYGCSTAIENNSTIIVSLPSVKPSGLTTSTSTLRSPINTKFITKTMTLTNSTTLTSNGAYLAYFRNAADQLYLIFEDSDANGMKSFTYPIEVDYHYYFPVLSKELSPDGKWLAYFTGMRKEENRDSGTFDPTLHIMSLIDKNSFVVTRLLSQNYPNKPILPATSWSPDGRYLAFAGQMDGPSSDIYLYDTYENNFQRMTDGSEEVISINWSPDGKWILESSTSYNLGVEALCDLFATPLNGSASHLLLHHTNNCESGGTWLDNKNLFRYSDGDGIGNYGLQLVNIESGIVRDIWKANFTGLSVSSDKSRIAFYSRNITPGMTQGTQPAPAGHYIVDLSDMLVSYRSDGNSYTGSEPGKRDMDTLGFSTDRMFLLRNEEDGSLAYLSMNGALTSLGIKQTINISISPNRKYWIAVARSNIQVYRADGTFIRDIVIPKSECPDGCLFWDRDFLWRPDSSGLFLVMENNRIRQYLYNHLYALDLLNGEPKYVENRLWGFTDYLWIYGH